VTYVWPAHESPTAVCAQQGGIAVGRDASGNTVTYNGGTPAGGSVATCADTAQQWVTERWLPGKSLARRAPVSK